MKVLGLPKGKIYLSLSGGIDSMVLAHFLMNGKKDFSVIHFDHRTKYGERARIFVDRFCKEHNIECQTYDYLENKGTEFGWAQWRKKVLVSLSHPVLTAHHKDDSLESVLMRGQPILYQCCNIYRPLLASSKDEIRQYGANNDVNYIEDHTNSDPTSGLRNKIRNLLIPMMRECQINPYSFLEQHNVCQNQCEQG